MLDEFDKTGETIEDDKEDDLDEETSLEETIVRARPVRVDVAVEIIRELDIKVKLLEEEMKQSKIRISNQNNLIATKKDSLLVFQGTVNSLEEEIRNHEARSSRFEKAVANMKGEIVHLRESKAGGDRNKKLKKDLKEAEARDNDKIKKIEELVTSKARVFRLS